MQCAPLFRPSPSFTDINPLVFRSLMQLLHSFERKQRITKIDINCLFFTPYTLHCALRPALLAYGI